MQRDVTQSDTSARLCVCPPVLLIPSPAPASQQTGPSPPLAPPAEPHLCLSFPVQPRGRGCSVPVSPSASVCPSTLQRHGEDGRGLRPPPAAAGKGRCELPRVIYHSSECRCAAAAPGDIFSPLQGITAARAREQQEGGREGEVPQHETLPAFLLQKPFPGRIPAPGWLRGHARAWHRRIPPRPAGSRGTPEQRGLQAGLGTQRGAEGGCSTHRS